jgi:small neutral amino acid transporter SnatA (MarC family)
MSLAIFPLAITMNAGPQIMSALIFITAPKPLKLSASFLAGVIIALSVGVTITYTLATALNNSISFGDPSDATSIGNII